MPAYKLVSATIMHRHGARGPGESELSPWDENSKVFTQWDEKDLEVINRPGHVQMESLGIWFAEYITRHGILESSALCDVLWRCSKSDRAKESGEDFVSTVNAALGRKLFENPVPFDENADMYFRPWKIYKDEVTKNKNEVLASNDFKNKLRDNEDFIKMIGDLVEVKKEYKTNFTKCLWSMTHIQNVLECERWWYPEPREDGSLNERFELSLKITDSEVKRKLEELACWVLDQRFVESSFRVELGGVMCDEVLQTILDGNYKISIYSGHDYTILAVLSAMGLIDRLQVPLSFGCFLLFEIWESETLAGEEVEKLVRIILNPCPFNPPKFDGSPITASDLPVHDIESIVLAEVDIKEMSQILRRIQGHFVKKGMKMSRSGRFIGSVP